jgi:hypothetical protein
MSKSTNTLTQEHISALKKEAKQVGETLENIQNGNHVTDNEMLQFITIIEPVVITLKGLGKEYRLAYSELDGILSKQKEYADARGILPK